MNLYWSLAIAIAGALLYGFSTNVKAAEVGRIAFWVGLFVFLFKVLGTQTVNPFR
jgi:hypothetical protein